MPAAELALSLSTASRPTGLGADANCPICGSTGLHYLFSASDGRVVRCKDCGLMLHDPREPVAWAGNGAAVAVPAADLLVPLTQAVKSLALYRGDGGGRMLAVTNAVMAGALPARHGDWEIRAVRPVALEDRSPIEAKFDVVALFDVIDFAPDPAQLLEQARALLGAGGVLVVSATSFDIWSARRLRHRLTDFQPGRRFFLTHATLETWLNRSGFEQIIFQATESGPGRAAPDGMMFLARPAPARAGRPKLSVVVPAYNEAQTFANTFEKLLAKTLPGLDLEIIVVESNSTDGTREIVARYEQYPRVKVIWEDRPRGKGRAVRRGLEQASGEYVLIQDADLEYDLEDYEALLEPLVSGRAAFVLGARHGGDAWKMRDFSGQPVVSGILNLAHWFFTLLVNIGFGARMKDPFTMYKVFRRDCLYGLEFECDRFDFDFELVIKLLRKGYQPLEIPVNYRSRTFAEGKKVSWFADPLTWLQALLKLRLERMDPLENVARARRRAALDKPISGS